MKNHFLLGKCLITFFFFTSNLCAHTNPEKELTSTQQTLLKISGVVTDKTGPLPGVTVMVKGTQNGTMTDASGQYAISVPNKDAILTFAYLGYISQELSLQNRAVINVLMSEDSHQIEEVIVVGYGVQKKVNLVGAVSAVKVDEKLSGRSLPNVSSGLSGLVPGLAVTQNRGMAGNNGASLRIRGLGSIDSKKDPLVVVDGMPDVDINRLDMNDIESISVLKDAASSAVYGSRAANGVILITTKSGKNSEKTKITFSGTYGIEHPAKKYEFMADYPRALTLQQSKQLVGTLPANLLFKNGTVDQWMALGMIDPMRYPNTDWWDIILRDGTVQHYNVSATGGNDRSNFYLSIGMMDEEGLQINNDYTRYNARFNFDYKLRNNMNVGAKFSGNWSNYLYALEQGFTDSAGTNTSGFDMRFAIAGITPYDPVSGYYGGVMAYNEDPQAYNPYTVYMNQLNHRNRQEANGSMYWDWTPFKGLVARLEYALNYYNQFSWNAPTPNQSYNFQTDRFGSRVYVGANAGVSNFTNTGYKTQLGARLNYGIKIAEKHDISAMFAYNEEYWYNRYQGSSRNDRLHPSLHEIDAALTDIQSTGGNSSTEGLLSYVGRLNYTAYDKYLLELNFRVDGSSRFLPGNQYGFFPSAAIGWRFTEENFIRSLTESWLNHGKFRASYGSLGNNSGVGLYDQQETLDDNHYMIGGNIAKGFIYRKMVNKDLTWETSTVANVGLDLGFVGNKLTAELDYYDRHTTNLIRPSEMSILLTGAYQAPKRNIGELQNRGMEANLTWRDKINDFSYSVNFNAAYNKMTVQSWNEFLDKGWTFVGMPYHYVYAYESLGIAQTWEDVYNATPQGASPGDILRKDVNGDGRIDGNDKIAHTNFQRDSPTTNFGLSGNASWKGFDFSFLFQGTHGRKTFWINNYNDMNFGDSRQAISWQQQNEHWSWQNREGGMPRLGGNINREESTFWLDDMSYIRLKNIQLGYTIPPKLLKKIGLSNVRIYGTGENIMTFTKFRGLDPEMEGNTNDTYPMTKSYSIGLNIGI